MEPQRSSDSLIFPVKQSTGFMHNALLLWNTHVIPFQSESISGIGAKHRFGHRRVITSFRYHWLPRGPGISEGLEYHSPCHLMWFRGLVRKMLNSASVLRISSYPHVVPVYIGQPHEELIKIIWSGSLTRDEVNVNYNDDNC
jgi:hypothetical protein